jgi:hypothetical protein
MASGQVVQRRCEKRENRKKESERAKQQEDAEDDHWAHDVKATKTDARHAFLELAHEAESFGHDPHNPEGTREDAECRDVEEERDLRHGPKLDFIETSALGLPRHAPGVEVSWSARHGHRLPGGKPHRREEAPRFYLRPAGQSRRMDLVLWLIAVVLVIFGIITIVRGAVLWGIVLIIVGLLVGPGGVSIFT